MITIKKYRVLLFGGTLLLLFPIHWIYVLESNTKPLEQILSSYPSFIQNDLFISIFAMLCCITAMVFSYIVINENTGWRQSFSSFIMVCSGIMALWLLIGPS